MPSTVNLPKLNHTFTGQAYSSKRLTSTVHILSQETDRYDPSHLDLHCLQRYAGMIGLKGIDTLQGCFQNCFVPLLIRDLL